ncbi:MAG: MFS transporter, partial [Candidatus Marinimicrobia bacterium]|nr:MFS transporter [Candidatus Neomarinimicrobiota bacterium]
IALIWLTLDLTGSNASAGMIMAMAYLPFLLFSLPAGVFADSWQKVSIIRFTSFIRIFIALIIPIFALQTNLSLWLIATAAFLLTGFSAFYIPARDSLIPEYLEDKHLFRANSLVQGSMQFAYILGPILAGFLIDILGNTQIFFFVSSIFLIAALFSLPMKKITMEKNKTKSISLQDIREVFQLMKKDKRLLWIIIITMVDNLFIMGPAIIGIAVFVRTVIQGSASDYALCESFLAFGMVSGTIIILRFGKKLPLGKMLIWGIFFDGLTYIPVYFIGNIKLLWLIIFLHALFIPMITISRTTLIQKLVPSNMHGRFFALVSISVIGFTAISSAFTGWASEIVAIQSLFAIIGIGAALSGVAAWFYKPLREL